MNYAPTKHVNFLKLKSLESKKKERVLLTHQFFVFFLFVFFLTDSLPNVIVNVSNVVLEEIKRLLIYY